MPAIGRNYLSFWIGSARLPLLFVALAAASGGCTLLVGEQLSDKPSEDAGDGGQGGSGGAPSTGSQSSSAAQSSAAQSSTAQSSTGSSWTTCPKNLANCDGKLLNGCETHVDTDDKNCGSCATKCDSSKHCEAGKCQ